MLTTSSHESSRAVHPLPGLMSDCYAYGVVRWIRWRYQMQPVSPHAFDVSDVFFKVICTVVVEM